MNILKSISPIILIMAALALLSGCGDSKSPSESEVVEVKTLGAYTVTTPMELTHVNYTVPPSLISYVTFSLEQESVIIYMISDGTVEFLDENGTPVHSDIFFPVENDYKTLPLEAGTYMARVQNSTLEDISFSIFSTGLPLECTTIYSSGRILVGARSHEFMEMEIQHPRTMVDLSLPGGTVTIFDQNLIEIVPASTGISRILPAGHYLLLVDNTSSQTRGALNAEISAGR